MTTPKGSVFYPDSKQQRSHSSLSKKGHGILGGCYKSNQPEAFYRVCLGNIGKHHMLKLVAKQLPFLSPSPPAPVEDNLRCRFCVLLMAEPWWEAARCSVIRELPAVPDTFFSPSVQPMALGSTCGFDGTMMQCPGGNSGNSLERKSANKL